VAVNHGYHSNIFPSQQFQSSEYLSGYFGCFEDLTKVAQLTHQHRQLSATGTLAPFGTIESSHGSNFDGGNSQMPHTVNYSTELVTWNHHKQYQSSSTNFVFVNEPPPTVENPSANSLIGIVPRQIKSSNANADGHLRINDPANNVKAPIRFVYTSVPKSAGSRPPLGQAGPQRRHRSKEAALAVKRRNVRKKGAACGLCGEHRVKVSHCFRKTILVLTVSSAML
jgi:hypothetical protein